MTKKFVRINESSNYRVFECTGVDCIVILIVILLASSKRKRKKNTGKKVRAPTKSRRGNTGRRVAAPPVENGFSDNDEDNGDEEEENEDENDGMGREEAENLVKQYMRTFAEVCRNYVKTILKRTCLSTSCNSLDWFWFSVHSQS